MMNADRFYSFPAGIGREESQFMDQSNADINNVFNMNR